MADAMSLGRPEQALFWREEGASRSIYCGEKLYFSKWTLQEYRRRNIDLLSW